MAADLILVLDEGTTSTRAIAFTLSGEMLESASRPITQHYPHPGWVEHDAGEIWRASRDCLLEVAPLSAQGLFVHRAAFGADEDEGTVAAAGVFGVAVFAAVVAGVAA